MRYFILFALAVCCFAATVQAQRTPEREALPEKEEARVATTKFFIKLTSHRTIPYGAVQFGITEVDAVLAEAGVQGIRRFHERRALNKGGEQSQSGIERLYIVSISPMEDIVSFLNRFKGLAEVEYAAPYRLHRWTHTPGDPMYSNQWALKQLRLDEAWEVTTGDSTIVIGIIDSGMDLEHPDLAPNLFINQDEWGVNGELSNNGIDDDGNGFVDDWRGWDIIGKGSADNPKPDNDPTDSDAEHGTSVAGCASAATNNGIGIAAPGYRSKLLPVKVGADIDLGVEGGYEGLLYAVNMGCRVINCSWYIDQYVDPPMTDLIDYAFDNGSLVVVASGNSGFRLDINSGQRIIQRALYVGSSRDGGFLSTFSNYGVSVDVCAPGEDILATAVGGGYRTATGTSFSSPHTAGVAALVFAVHPDWTPDQVAKQLRVTSSEFPAGRSSWDYGMVDAYQAVTKNSAMQDIPGVRLRRIEVRTPAGDGFSEGGQTAFVTAVFENLLAPTSNAAYADLVLSSAHFTSATTRLQIGALGTMDSVALTFELTLNASFKASEAWLPVQFNIVDGEYTDYALHFVEVYNENGWHLSYEPRGAYIFRNIKAVDENIVWAVAQTGYYSYAALRSTDGGITWKHAMGPGFPRGYYVATIAPVSADTAIIGTWSEPGYSGSVYRTTNGGATWQRTAVNQITAFVNGIHMFDAQNGILMGDPLNGKWGIGRTTNGGTTWAPIADQPIGNNEFGQRDAFDFIGDYGWFGTVNRKVYATSDAGATWKTLNLPSPNVASISLCTPGEALVKFVETSSGGNDIVGYTSNEGQTWTSFAPTPAGTYGFAHMETGGKKMWIGDGYFVFVSGDNGVSWKDDPTPYEMGFTIRCAESYSTETATYLWMAGGEIYRRVVPFEPKTVGVRPPGTPAEFALRAWPNPVASGAEAYLHIEGTTRGSYTLAVYDVYGRVVANNTLELDATAHTLALPTGGFAPGVYTVVLRHGAQHQTVRLTVIH